VQDFVTRFAPSPTGRLHLGHAFSAMTAHEASREAGGRFLLRIEDIDRQRSRPEFEAAIYEDLAWLSIAWETPVRRQSEHMADYEAALEILRARGLLYRCFRTRREVLDEIARAPHGVQEVFRGGPSPFEEEARRIEAGEPFAWRLSLDRAKAVLGSAWNDLTYIDLDHGVQKADPLIAGDVVLSRKGVGVAYHLASVIDDALQGVTHVIRGEDLRDAAPVQRLLQTLLDLPAPAYRHHRLLLDPEGRRLAKRAGSKSLGELRAEGASAATIRADLGFPSQ
jgi:glutamyl-Q tRNA(Asp) synthetase